VSVFRDEMCDLLIANEDAKRLQSQTFTLAEFLEKKAPDFKIPQLNRNAIVHGHCHHKSIMRMDSEQKVLQKMGLHYHLLDSGCCGMAGYFGYLKGDKYEVSVKAGERVLLPAVRNVDKKTLVITDGYSCREQIEQMTDREGMHLAQVLQMALHENDSKATNYPEKEWVDLMKLHSTGLKIKRAVAVISVVSIVALGCFLVLKKKCSHKILADAK
jgi:Fe-S oxidoreductase